jgi:excisionase family DNA binding protein
MMDVKDSLLTTKEAAKFLRISSSTLYRMEKLGLIYSYRTPGGQRRFSMKALMDYLKKSQNFQSPKKFCSKKSF